MDFRGSITEVEVTAIFSLERSDQIRWRKKQRRGKKTIQLTCYAMGMTIGMGCVHVGRDIYCTHLWDPYVPSIYTTWIYVYIFFLIFNPCH